MKRTRWLVGPALAVLLFPQVSAAQERWLINGAGSYAGPISDPYEHQFGSGGIGDLGAYRSLMPWVLVGARLSAGGLAGDNDVENTVLDRGAYGIGMLSAALRVRPLAGRADPRRGTGLWLEGTGGPGIVESDVRAVFTGGLGYVFDAGMMGLGPVARYIQAVESGAKFGGQDGQLATIGLELMFLDAHRPREGAEVPSGGEYVPPPPPLQPAARVTAPSDLDNDGIQDSADKCPRQPETQNGINDYDGCPDDKLEFVEDRLVIGEHVLFNFDSAILLESGQEKLRELADLYKRTGSDWKMLKVQGFTDVRGSFEYNAELGVRRAEAVKRYLVSLDVPEEKISIESYGELKPVIPNATTEAEHRQNRRVEFAVEHQK